MNYLQAYNFLVSLKNIPRQEYLKDPRHCGLYLKRLQYFLDILGNPEKQIPHYIHVTGTSGKGSVCLMLNSILRVTGQSVGLITSPHPTVITERCEINGRPISKKDFTKLIISIKPKLDEYIRTSPYDMLSFFEIITALGLYYFAQKKIQWAILEVGLGGRYDSTNIIPYKDVAVITNIGLDHLGIIGKNKKEIAYEKAGIIKPGCRVFTMEKNKNILAIFSRECARASNCELKIVNYKNENYNLPVLGSHQNKNAKLAITIARSLKIPEAKIRRGLNNVRLPIRMEIIAKQPLMILDGAHNPDKMRTTIATIKALPVKKKLHLIIGFANDKQWPLMIKQLTILKPTTIACTRFTSNPFRLVANPRLIADKFKKFLPTTKIKIFLEPQAALNWTNQQAKNSDLILATGSIFLSGEIKTYI